MTDVALVPAAGFNTDFTADIALSLGDLLADDGMDTAIILSLFCDARAADDDALPQIGGDRRGWWGDAYAQVAGDVWGSKLWLLSRAKATAATLSSAQQYAQDALAWMVTDGVAASVTVTATYPALGFIGLSIAIAKPDQPGEDHYDYVWRFA